MLDHIFRFLDRISRPEKPRAASPRRQGRLRLIIFIKNLVLGTLLAIALAGVITFLLLVAAPTSVIKAEQAWRFAHWIPLYARLHLLDAAINTGINRIALWAADLVFRDAKTNVRVLDHGYEPFIQSLTRSMNSPLTELRRRAAEASIAHHDYDSLAWLTVARSRSAANDPQAEQAYLRALAMRPFWPQASAELFEMYSASQRLSEAKKLKRDTARATLSLLGAGLPVHLAVQRTDGTASGVLRMVDNCRPRLLQLDIPSDTRSAFLTLPGANGLVAKFTRLGSVSQDGRWNAWRITETAHVTRPSPNEFVSAITGGGSADGIPVLNIEPIGGIAEGQLVIELTICPTLDLMIEAGLRPGIVSQTQDSNGRYIEHP